MKKLYEKNKELIIMMAVYIALIAILISEVWKAFQ